jgi:hypothetical protein
MSTQLLTEIEAFLRRTGMGEYRFGLLAARNGRLLERLRTPRSNGRPARVWPETEADIRAFMRQRDHAASAPKQTEAA